MEIATKNLIQAVEEQRTKRRMSDSKFSKQVLGISPAYWCLLKAGTRRLSPNLAVLFMQKLPEITPEVRIFIMRQGNDGDNQKTGVKTGGQNHPAPVIRRTEAKQPQKT